jgi:hypothetical protein
MIREGSLSKVAAILSVALVGSVLGCTDRLSEERSPALANDAPYLESEIPPANQPTPRAEVTSSDGIEPRHAAREFSAAAQRLRACPNDGRVPVRVRVENVDGRTEIAFADSVPPLSPESRRCVLDAMSTVDVDDIASRGSPSNRPLGFTANVLLSW